MCSAEELPDIHQDKNKSDLDLHENDQETSEVVPDKITYDCGICREPFPSFSALYEHRNQQHPNVKYKCDQCPNTYFGDKKDFDKHLNENHRLECKYCQKIFFFKSQLQRHIRIKHEKVYKCRLCESEFENLSLKQHHEKSQHSQTTDICWVCGRGVKNLNHHLKTHDRAATACRLCEQVFENITQRNYHLQDVHFLGKRFVCDVCNERFLGEKGLQNHKELKHSGPGVINYTCEKCGGGFKTSMSFEFHKRRLKQTGVCGRSCPREMMITQPGEVMKRNSTRKYLRRDKICDVCGRRFFLKRVLNRHRKFHFLHGERTMLDKLLNEPEFHNCSDCDKRFYSKTMLMAHQATHTGEVKPFHCEFCGKNFRVLANLTQHRRRHTIDRVWQCRLCNKRFYRKASFLYHEKTHSKISKSFNCDKCERTFKLKRFYEKHAVKCNGKCTTVFFSGIEIEEEHIYYISLRNVIYVIIIIIISG